MSKRQARYLTEEGLDFLGRRKLRLLSVLSYGMGKSRRLKLAEHLIDYVHMEWGIELELISFESVDTDSLEQDIYSFIEMVLISGNPVCIELKGTLKHFTVISGLSDDHIELFDSDGLTRISRQAVHIGKGETTRRHSLRPSGIMGMRIMLQRSP